MKIPSGTGTTVTGIGMVIIAGTAYVLHLAFPGRPIGELLIGGFLHGGLWMIGLPQHAAPPKFTAPSSAQPRSTP